MGARAASRDFLKLWAGQTISLLGSQIGGGALRYTALLTLGAGPTEVSLLTAASTLPVLLLGLPAGALADRLRRRPLLIAADLGRAALLVAVTAAWALGVLRVELLYVAALLSGALTTLFDTAYQAYVPSLVERGQLERANSRLSASESLAEVAGPPLGGAVVQLLSAPLALLADALSFIWSAALLALVRAPEPPPAPAGDEAPWRAALGGVRLALSSAALRALLGVALIDGLAGGVIGSLYDLFLLRELGLSPAVIGLTIGVGGASALAGALLAGRIVRRLGLGRAMLASAVLTRLAGLLLPLAAGPWALAAVLISQASDVGHTIYGIGAVGLRQTLAPHALLGRVAAAFLLLPTAAALVGALLAGPLVGALGVRGALAAAFALGLLAIVVIARSPLVALSRLPDDRSAEPGP